MYIKYTFVEAFLKYFLKMFGVALPGRFKIQIFKEISFVYIFI